jgi:DNA processing protein
MSPTDWAALAVLGNRDRRLMAALLRVLAGRETAEDTEALPKRHPNETVVQWACRFRQSAEEAASSAVRAEREAAAQLARATHHGVEPLPFLDARYPATLGAIPDPPPVLWVKGNVDALHRPAIALVGSRAATPQALALAKRLAMDLADRGIVIVSGLARGVDSAAHAGALSASGTTVGVLGCGLDRVYPSEHRDLARDMQERGAIVSEFPVGVPPLKHHFPLRNRIISGLATAVVVVEAPEKSGSLITAAAAMEQGREVLVVPGPAAGGRNRGGHLLLRDGASLVESAADILAALDLPGARQEAASAIGQWTETADFTVDDVAQRTGEPAAVVLARLLDLELTGRIRRIGGGRFVRVCGPGGVVQSLPG